jgi:protein-S-isoprenylcysteine O-methyltransferase Ste14
MAKRNSIWGVGPKLVASGAGYFLLLRIIDKLLGPLPAITANHSLLYAISAVLLLIGAVIWIIAARTIFMMYRLDRLYRQGLYAYCRHPLYADFILFVLPGLCIALNSWPALTTPVFMYLAFRHFIKEEESGLIDQFGEDYLRYRQEVNAVVPKLWK